MSSASDLWTAYKLRWRRRRYLARALSKRYQLRNLQDRTKAIAPGAILGFATMRNEIARLPHWLGHHRALGVAHFLIVDNASTDGTTELLAAQPDVSLWHTKDSYRLSRFGVDWLTALMMRYGHGHWCLTCDADEELLIPYADTRDLGALTGWLDQIGQPSMGALMLDLYPRGPLRDAPYLPGSDPTEALPFFDAHNYTINPQPRLQNICIQGGPRARTFFATEPRRAPTLSKVPLIKWNRRFAYVSSTHSALPRRLNHVYAQDGSEKISGILLHTKFLNTIVQRSAEERARGEHFANSDLYETYYLALEANPTLWCPKSTRYHGWRQLEAMGLMSRGGWM